MENASFFYCIFLTHRLEFLLGVKMNSFDFVFLGLVVQRVIQDDALNKIGHDFLLSFPFVLFSA